MYWYLSYEIQFFLNLLGRFISAEDRDIISYVSRYIDDDPISNSEIIVAIEAIYN